MVHVSSCRYMMIYVDTRSIKINRRIHIFAQLKEHVWVTEVVTVWYRAPEILLGSVGLLSAGELALLAKHGPTICDKDTEYG